MSKIKSPQIDVPIKRKTGSTNDKKYYKMITQNEVLRYENYTHTKKKNQANIKNGKKNKMIMIKKSDN